MNRRKAIFRIAVAGAAFLGVAAGYKWLSIRRTPNLGLLRESIPLLSALAETIIPETDTPGAASTGVGEFILIMVRDCASRAEQNNFLDGLRDLQAYSLLNHGQKYENCSVPEQESILKHFEAAGNRLNEGIIGKIKSRYLGRPFFRILKSYTVEGYFTSEAGATRALAYSYIPGSFHGCTDMKPGQKAWATR